MRVRFYYLKRRTHTHLASQKITHFLPNDETSESHCKHSGKFRTVIDFSVNTQPWELSTCAPSLNQMANSTPNFVRRARMPSVDSVLGTCGADDSSRRDQRAVRRHAYSDPEVHLPAGKQKHEEGTSFRSIVSHLLRRRSTNVSVLSNEETENPATLRTVMEKIFIHGEKTSNKMIESRRRLSFADVIYTQSTYQRVLERRRARLTLMKKANNKRLLRRKFQRVAKITIFCIRECHAHCLRNNDDDELSPFVKPLNFREYPAMAGVELMFDPSRFKANKQTRISDDIRRILSKPPSDRTDQELYTAQIALRNITCFQEYPARMQRLLAAVGIYERFEARRVLVRQGHPASSFYFILSGTVVVMVMDCDRKYARPVAYLYKGQTFGELAIINRTSRQSTVLAKESSEFLTISVEDYHRIFMAGGVKCLTDPDHEDFIRHLRFLDGWPLWRLQEHPAKCLFLYFKRGDVLVKDSHYSDWLIVVKSGSISVLKKLRRVEAYEWRRKHGSLYLAEKQQQEHEVRLQQWRKSILHELHVPLRQSVEDETDNHDNWTRRKLCSNTTVEALDVNTCKFFDSKVWQFGKPRDGKGLGFSIINLPDIKSKKPLGRVDTNLDESEKQQRQRMRMRNVCRPRSSTDEDSEMTSSGKREPDGVTNPRRQSVVEREREMMGFAQHVRTISEDLDAGIKRKDPDDVTPADLNPEFVKVETVTKGQVFGLADLLLGRQTSFCVVSNGADCLLINKQLYMDHVTDDLERRTRQQLCPYPSEEALQRSLQTSVDWNAYREVTLANTLKLVKQRKTGSVA
ncbi:uncharacterized protein LOC124270147 [Haliotis rubra]|uniref:uncharacterized protein LOC124270147 n=1 Tax=Haliotis rubra TaxID=36100 RepID=UPI001EE62705|nr:uncharacterized protein LOC124270147 [Haliotis rubra]